jgi:hypothetical protein
LRAWRGDGAIRSSLSYNSATRCRKDCIQPSGKLGRSRRAKIDVQLAQPIPRPLDPLLNVGVDCEQRTGDLRGAETAERAQRDGDAGCCRVR